MTTTTPCDICGGSGTIYVRNTEGGTTPYTCNRCSGTGVSR